MRGRIRRPGGTGRSIYIYYYIASKMKVQAWPCATYAGHESGLDEVQGVGHEAHDPTSQGRRAKLLLHATQTHRRGVRKGLG